jgi:hypothetical protein|tara:strand:- start:7858 stop:8745 length:888 start_codon:yes stop_codon:yes gene_type:complete
MAQITGNTSTVTTGAVHIPEIWSADTIDAVEANLGIGGLITRRWEKEMKMGDIFRVGYISNLTASTKAAGTDVSLQAVTESEETVTVGTHNYVAVGVEDILKVQSKRDLRQKYTARMGYALGSASDVLIAAFAASFDNTVGTLGVPVTYDNLVSCDQNLNEANAPEEDRFVYISAATKADLLKMDELKNADYVGAPGSAVRRASIGSEIMGANVFMSTLVHSPGSNQSNNWFGQKSGAALIVQATKTRSDFILLADTDAVVATQIQGQTEVLVPPVTAGGGTALDNHNVTLRGNG